MTTSITLRATKGTPLTHNEVDANFTNLKTTADAAASDASQGLNTKANASAVGIASGDANMGTYTGTTIPDNETAKQNLQSLETAVETKANASAVGVTASAANMGTYTGSVIPDSQTAKQNIQSLETELELKNTALGIALGASNLGTFTGSIISDNTNVKTALQETETAVELRPTSATLAASGGSALVGYIQEGTGATASTIQAALRASRISLGLIGLLSDGTAQSPTAAQALIDWCAANSRVLTVPKGTFKFTGSLSLPDYLTIEGEDPLYSIIQASATTFPVFVNTTATTPRDVTIKRLQIKSGSYGIDLTASSAQSNWQLEDVLFLDNLTAGIRCNQMFILNSFTRVIFDSTNKGIICSAANANLNTFHDCEFKELANSAIEFLGGSEANTWFGCRFEARSQASDAGNNTISLQAGKCNKFIGCYFEDVFKSILNETGSTNTTEFNSCRFSGQENTGSGFQAETFTSNGIVAFSNCQFAISGGSNGAANMMLIGSNTGLNTRLSNIYHHNDFSRIAISTKSVAWASGVAEDLFTFTRTNTTASADNRSSMSGVLRVTCQGRLVDGTRFWITQTRPVLVIGTANDTMSIVLGTTVLTESNAPAATCVIAEKAGSTTTSLTVLATPTVANFDAGEISAYLDVHPVRSTGYPELSVSPVAA